MKKIFLVTFSYFILFGCSQSETDQMSNESSNSDPSIDAVSGASVPTGGDASGINFQSEGMNLGIEEIIRTGEAIWAMDFLDSNTMIFSERSGQVKLLSLKSGEVKPIPGGPIVLQHDSGGLFDIEVDRDFTNNQLLYFTYVKPLGSASVIALARAKYDGEKLVELVDLFIANNPSDDHAHWGSRVVMDKERFLYMTIGDRHVPNNAQDFSSHGGKLIRLLEDGAIPDSNPYVGKKNILPEIWSIGHRNPQGLTINPDDGVLFEQEHGPTGGDEINIIQPAINYGWPVITWGENIWGGQKKEGTEREGMQQPFKYFLPGIAPTGITFYNGDKYPGWKGNLFSSTLRGHLHRLVLGKNTVISEERLLASWGERLRDVVEAPDGLLYLASESGVIARLVLAE
ncbi:MAG: PQQ-dependent sugar dehydrogenase [Pseudomonadota bacterium]|nr:PQQ-dependent sugar dehydrogenase [Pseudomonadota bacterium]